MIGLGEERRFRWRPVLSFCRSYKAGNTCVLFVQQDSPNENVPIDK